MQANEQKWMDEMDAHLAELDRLISFPYDVSDSHGIAHLNYWKPVVTGFEVRAKIRQTHFSMLGDILAPWKAAEEGDKDAMSAWTNLKYKSNKRLMIYNCDGERKMLDDNGHGIALMNTKMINRMKSRDLGVPNSMTIISHFSQMVFGERKENSGGAGYRHSDTFQRKRLFASLRTAWISRVSLIDQCSVLQILAIEDSSTLLRCGIDWEVLEKPGHLNVRRLPNLSIFVEGKTGDVNYKKHLVRSVRFSLRVYSKF